MPAPDHLVFHGLTKCLIKGIFAELDDEHSRLVGTSFRDALTRSHLASTCIYNPQTKAVVSVGISEWAATLTVASFVFRRVLPEASLRSGGAPTPVHVGLQLLDAYTTLVNALYFFPRADLDGVIACRQRLSAEDLRSLGETFFQLVCAACLRGDTAALGRSVDKPNLHRLREPLDHAVPALLHVRHAQELLFESAHQPVKRAIVTGNGWDDAGRALERVRQCELASRLTAQPSFFGVPSSWMDHAGVRVALSKTMSLSSQPSGMWRSGGRRLASALVPVAVRALVACRYAQNFEVKWWKRASRSGSDDKVRAGDALAVLVLPSPGQTTVNVAREADCSNHLSVVAFYSLAAVFTTPQGTPSAAVHPFEAIPHTADVAVDTTRVLYLPLDALVRRALVLHSCNQGCAALQSGARHSSLNRWRVFGRADGYPSRQG